MASISDLRREVLPALLALTLCGCGTARLDHPSESYLELLQIASHADQRGERSEHEHLGGLCRFDALRDRLTATGYLAHGELLLPVVDEHQDRRHVASCLWLFDSLELGRLSLALERHNADTWRVTYWIRREREAALRRQLERLAQTPAAMLLSRSPPAGYR